MKQSNAAQALLLLALVAGISMMEAARERIIVKNHGIKFHVDWWDDGRAAPYQVSFTKKRVFSEYTFNAAGRLTLLYVDDAGYEFNMAVIAPGDTSEVRSLSAPSDRMLFSMQEETEAVEMESNHHRRRLYECSDCERTWDSICDIGLQDVCFWVGKEKILFTEDTQTSIKKMCKKFTRECNTSAETTCDGLCTEGEFNLRGGQICATFPSPKITPAPAPAPNDEQTGPCDPDPCQNGGSCTIDPAGGHVCLCASVYGGMACQIDTSPLESFYIEIEYKGAEEDWTPTRRAVFQSAANKWSDVITHVPCGGSAEYPGGRLLISSTLKAIDGNGNVLGSAGPESIWLECNTISLKGSMTFDIDDITSLEEDGIFEGVVLHEMGHVIGVGTLWGSGYGECTTCSENGSSDWTCPAVLSAYADIGGSGSGIVELDGHPGTTCGHLDETIFADELMTGYIDNVRNAMTTVESLLYKPTIETMYLSKITAAILDDLHYVVNPSSVDAYTLPSKRGFSALSRSSSPSIPIQDIAVKTTIAVVDDDGKVVEEKDGIMMEF